MSRRILPSVLHNFLGALSSRNSDYDGYWIFGLFVDDLRHSAVDLLADRPAATVSPSWNAFVALARHRFAEQLRASSVLEFVRAAELSVERGGSLSGTVNGSIQNGFEVILSVEAVSDLERVYRRRTSLFVAPHRASIERRSVRRGMDALTRREP